MIDLRKATALITGASHGIGAATARRLAQEGTRVLLTGLDGEEGRRLAGELGAPHRFIEHDVTNLAHWRELARVLEADDCVPDIAILNAGTNGKPFGTPSGPHLEWLNAKTIDHVLSVNLYGVAYGLAHLWPLMRGRGEGIIIATASSAGIDAHLAHPAYSGSKAAVLAMVRSAAAEMAVEGVRLCAISPGSIDTRIYPSDMAAHRRLTGRIAQPGYIAGAVVHVIRHGEAGDLWIARPEDSGYWVFEPRGLPKPGEAPAAGARFVAASDDGRVG